MDLVAEYNNRVRVPEHPQIIEGWRTDATAYRAEVQGAELDVAYGARLRNRVDLFHAARSDRRPAVVFIHCGYWRSLDKSMFSHVAAGAVDRGLTAAIAGYTLCPEVTIPDIIDEIRQCCVFLSRRLARPLVIVGHSAGGHLAACLAATDWVHYGMDAGLIRGGMGISGIYDLRPLLATPINDDLKLTATTAALASPLLWPMPNRCPFHLEVGTEESGEFLRQSRSLAAAWTGLGLDAPYGEVPGANHFSILSHLADPDGEMMRRVAELAAG